MGEGAGPLKVMHWVPAPEEPLPHWSPAVMFSVKAVPAVGVGVDKVKPTNGPAFTVKVFEVTLAAPDTTFSVVFWAS